MDHSTTALTNIPEHVERLRSLPLTRLVDSNKAELSDVDDALEEDHDPWPPVSVVRKWTNGEQEDKLDGEEDTV